MRMSHTQINCTCKVDLFTLYFRLLWYHSISRGSIDQNTLKQTKFEDKTVKSTQPLLVLIGLHDFLIFSNRTVHAWSVEAGNICSVSVFFVRVGGQISPRRAKKDSNIPSPGRARSVKCPTPGPTKTIKSPPHALPVWFFSWNLFFLSLRLTAGIWGKSSLDWPELQGINCFWMQILKDYRTRLFKNIKNENCYEKKLSTIALLTS